MNHKRGICTRGTQEGQLHMRNARGAFAHEEHTEGNTGGANLHMRNTRDAFAHKEHKRGTPGGALHMRDISTLGTHDGHLHMRNKRGAFAHYKYARGSTGEQVRPATTLDVRRVVHRIQRRAGLGHAEGGKRGLRVSLCREEVECGAVQQACRPQRPTVHRVCRYDETAQPHKQQTAQQQEGKGSRVCTPTSKLAPFGNRLLAGQRREQRPQMFQYLTFIDQTTDPPLLDNEVSDRCTAR